MIGRIARKELLLNILILRFTIGIVLFLVLAVLFTYVLLGDYGMQLGDYDRLVSRNSDEYRQLMTYQNLKPTIYKPPEVLAIFSKGTEGTVRNSARIQIGEVPEVKSSVASKNPYLAVFPVLDVVLILKLVVSILAILVVYDTISGEREDETLKLMLSNSLPRHQLLFGKFVGGMVTLAIPVAVGFLMVSLILEFSPVVELTGDDWVRIGLMFVVSLVMVSVLLNLGLLLSSVTKRASNTLMLLLFLWVLFLLIIPNGSVRLAAWIRPIEQREKMDSQVAEMWERFQREVSDFHKENPWPDDTIQSDGSEPWGWHHEFATKNLILHKQKRNAFTEPLRISYADDAWQATRSYLGSMKRQKELADLISRASPLSLYEALITSLSRTDVPNSESFARQAREHRQQVIDYLYSIDAFSSIRYFATTKPEYLSDTSDDDYGRLRERHGRGASPLDVSAIPHFRYHPESAADTVERIFPDIAILCFMSVFLFMCAFAAFLRCDVR